MWTVISSAATADTSRYRLREGVILVIASDGSGRLIDLDGEACAVNVSGTAMLQGALTLELDAACAALAGHFQSEPSYIRADMEAFLASVERRGLLIPAGAVARRRSLVAGSLPWLIVPILALCRKAPTRLHSAKAWMLLAAAFLSTRMFGWPSTLRVWQVVRDRGMDSCIEPRIRTELLDAIEAGVARAAALFPLEASCKERALCCYALTRAIGADSRVVLGIDLFPFALHCWCALGDRILADQYDGKCERFKPVAVYA